MGIVSIGFLNKTFNESTNNSQPSLTLLKNAILIYLTLPYLKTHRQTNTRTQLNNAQTKRSWVGGGEWMEGIYYPSNLLRAKCPQDFELTP